MRTRRTLHREKPLDKTARTDFAVRACHLDFQERGIKKSYDCRDRTRERIDATRACQPRQKSAQTHQNDPQGAKTARATRRATQGRKTPPRPEKRPGRHTRKAKPAKPRPGYPAGTPQALQRSKARQCINAGTEGTANQQGDSAPCKAKASAGRRTTAKRHHRPRTRRIPTHGSAGESDTPGRRVPRRPLSIPPHGGITPPPPPPRHRREGAPHNNLAGIPTRTPQPLRSARSLGRSTGLRIAGPRLDRAYDSQTLTGATPSPAPAGQQQRNISAQLTRTHEPRTRQPNADAAQPAGQLGASSDTAPKRQNVAPQSKARTPQLQRHRLKHCARSNDQAPK